MCRIYTQGPDLPVNEVKVKVNVEVEVEAVYV